MCCFILFFLPFLTGLPVSLLYSFAFVIKIIYANVTHTLMESCCVEEFFPSSEIEGIWGFTRAIAMVGGVSLVIFFSLFKRTDLEEEKISNWYEFSQDAEQTHGAITRCFVWERHTTANGVCKLVQKKNTNISRIQIPGSIFRNHNDGRERRKVWTSHGGFQSSMLRFYSLCSLSAASQHPEVQQTRILSQGFSLLCCYLVSTSTSWSPVRHLTKKPYYSSTINPHHSRQDSIGWLYWTRHHPLE